MALLALVLTPVFFFREQSVWVWNFLEPSYGLPLDRDVGRDNRMWGFLAHFLPHVVGVAALIMLAALSRKRRVRGALLLGLGVICLATWIAAGGVPLSPVSVRGRVPPSRTWLTALFFVGPVMLAAGHHGVRLRGPRGLQLGLAVLGGVCMLTPAFVPEGDKLPIAYLIELTSWRRSGLPTLWGSLWVVVAVAGLSYVLPGARKRRGAFIRVAIRVLLWSVPFVQVISAYSLPTGWYDAWAYLRHGTLVIGVYVLSAVGLACAIAPEHDVPLGDPTVEAFE